MKIDIGMCGDTLGKFLAQLNRVRMFEGEVNVVQMTTEVLFLLDKRGGISLIRQGQGRRHTG